MEKKYRIEKVVYQEGILKTCRIKYYPQYSYTTFWSSKIKWAYFPDIDDDGCGHYAKCHLSFYSEEEAKKFLDHQINKYIEYTVKA